MEKHKKSYGNNKFKISAPMWKAKFELPDRLYSVSDIQDYFQVYHQKHDALLCFLTETLTEPANKNIYQQN